MQGWHSHYSQASLHTKDSQFSTFFSSSLLYMMPHAGPSFSSNKGSSQNMLLPPSCGGISEISYLWLCSITPQVLADKCKCPLLVPSIKSNSSGLVHTGA